MQRTLVNAKSSSSYIYSYILAVLWLLFISTTAARNPQETKVISKLLRWCKTLAFTQHIVDKQQLCPVLLGIGG